MKLTLINGDQKKDFYTRGISAGASLAAYDLLDEIGEKAKDDPAALYGKAHREQLLRFVVELFGGQFTEQEFLEGYMDSFFTGVPEMLRSVVAGVNAKVQAFPNVPAGDAAKA